MIRWVSAGVALLLLVGAPAFAHRLDEYLLATLISVERERLHLQMRLTPGVTVFSAVWAGIDTDGDGRLSVAEQRAYAARVKGDLLLLIDGYPARLRLAGLNFPSTAEMKEGRGEIQFDFEADVPGGGLDRTVVFENHHQRVIAAYLVNALVPTDPAIRITQQTRSEMQTLYELDYEQRDRRSGALSMGWWLGGAALLVVGRFAWWWPAREAATAQPAGAK